MDKFEKKMKDAGLNEAAIAAFRLNYDQLTQGATGMVRRPYVLLYLCSSRNALVTDGLSC